MEFDNIVSVYQYGSHVYGTSNFGSDWDFIVVAKDPEDIRLASQVTSIAKRILGIEPKKFIQIDVHAYSEDEFLAAVSSLEISFLECVNQSPLYGKSYSLPHIDKKLLRDSISKKSSNSWVKAKKKLAPLSVDYAPKIGKKSAWHSLRILMLGIQLAEKGKIEDFQCANSIYPSIMSCDSWEEIDMQFRSVYNHLSTEFRKVAPK